MRSRSQKAYRRARLAFGENGLPKIRFRHPLHAVALRKDARCAVFFCEGCQRPEDVDEIFLGAVGAAPHILVAVRELPHFARMDFDRLCEVELISEALRVGIGCVSTCRSRWSP